MDHLPFDHICPFGVPRAERIRGEGDSGHLDAALHDCLPHDHQSPCRPLRRHRSSGSARTLISPLVCVYFPHYGNKHREKALLPPRPFPFSGLSQHAGNVETRTVLAS
ncbi:hypothetical protein O3P69_011688 [Scylla paramamosain]|uniref:Uncharacterized protein n=1 Tax=Scylla paramamosain TaxID=85552 RepID=A0AAW0SEG7_SCYPA